MHFRNYGVFAILINWHVGNQEDWLPKFPKACFKEWERCHFTWTTPGGDEELWDLLLSKTPTLQAHLTLPSCLLINAKQMMTLFSLPSAHLPWQQGRTQKHLLEMFSLDLSFKTCFVGFCCWPWFWGVLFLFFLQNRAFSTALFCYRQSKPSCQILGWW